MSIEKKALDVIVPCLEQIYQTVSKGKKKTFDLSVDGADVEVKGKGKPFAEMDFISFTNNQYNAIQNGPNFDIYLVCGVNTEKPEKYRISSDKLKPLRPRPVTSYEFDRNQLQSLLGTDLEKID
jgi:hypothetical protein